MSQKKKVLIYIHLLFAFLYLGWLVAQPIIRQTAATKAASLLFSSITKHSRFDELAQEKQIELLKGHESLKEGTFRPLATRFVYSQAGSLWLLFSFVICFGLLLNWGRVRRLIWILPLVTVLYAFTGSRAPPLKGERLFPSEEMITERYIGKDETFKKDQDQLVEAWNRYLIDAWAKEEPSKDLALRADQLDRGVFYFNVERADWVLGQRGEDAVVAHLLFRPPLALLIAAIMWNLFFAWRIQRLTRSEAQSPKSVKVPA